MQKRNANAKTKSLAQIPGWLFLRCCGLICGSQRRDPGIWKCDQSFPVLCQAANGDTFLNFSPLSKIFFSGSSFSSDQVQITEGSSILDIDIDNDGIFETNVRLEGSFQLDAFVVEETESGTIITYDPISTIEYLPDLTRSGGYLGGVLFTSITENYGVQVANRGDSPYGAPVFDPDIGSVETTFRVNAYLSVDYQLALIRTHAPNRAVRLS